jgi:Transposase IS4
MTAAIRRAVTAAGTSLNQRFLEKMVLHEKNDIKSLTLNYHVKSLSDSQNGQDKDLISIEALPPLLMQTDNDRGIENPGADLPVEVPPAPPNDGAVSNNHGQVWYDKGEIEVDIGLSNRRTRILWSGNPNEPQGPQPLKPFLEYFKLMFPMTINQQMLDHTNASLAAHRFATTTTCELFKYFGLRLNMTLDRTGVNIPDFWMTAEVEGSTFVPPNYGRFGMSLHRFQTLSRCLRFAEYDEGVINEVRLLCQLHAVRDSCIYFTLSCTQDPWIPIRPFIDAFNTARENMVHPGSNVVIDECMSAWRGRDSFECIFVLPHKTKIIRKPEGVGAELKSLCDGESGILLHLELMEGKEAQAAKEFCDRYPSSIAMTLRIVKKYFHTGITVHADSAFSSVACAVALRSRGLFFMGCVKTASKRFPKSYLNNWGNSPDVERGSHKTLISSILLENNVEAPIFAIGWKDLTIKNIVCTRGITAVQGDPSVRHRRRIIEMEYGHENDRYDLLIPRPQAIEMFYSCFSNIDVHDHYRQGSLAFERTWSTKTWWHRLFMTIFGMICTDAYFAYRLEWTNRNDGDRTGMLTYKDFLYRLAFQLIHDGDGRRNLRRRRDDEEGDDNEGPVCFFFIFIKFFLCLTLPSTLTQDHKLSTLKASGLYNHLNDEKNENKRAKRRCSVRKCGKRTAWYCISCSNLNLVPPKIVCVCNPFTNKGSKCYNDHLDDLGMQ